MSMICPNCGSENKDGNKFCTKCGKRISNEARQDTDTLRDRTAGIASLVRPFDFVNDTTDRAHVGTAFENEETVILDEHDSYADENTAKLDDNDSFENEETVILDDSDSYADENTAKLDDNDSFENEETVILDEHDSYADENTARLSDNDSFENEETVILDDTELCSSDEEPAIKIKESQDDRLTAPLFSYRSVHRDDQQNQYQDTAYIDHLRKLKGLLDDGIITEDEFNQKKKQILGI